MKVTGGEMFIAITALAWRTGCFLVEGYTNEVSFDCKHGIVAEHGHSLKVEGRSGTFENCRLWCSLQASLLVQVVIYTV